jgi:hypothetical protein
MRIIAFKYIRFCVLLAFFILVGVCTAQKRCRIFGSVKTLAGDPIELANVRVLSQNIGTVTALNGDFTFYCNVEDSIEVEAFMIGYHARRKKCFPLADSVKIDFVLPSYSDFLGEATVIGQRIQTGTMQVLNPVDQRFQPSATGNAVEEMIATQAGVSTHNELSSQYNVRGGSFDENVVYLNGIEVYRPMLVRSGQQEGLSVINSDMVERIAFSSGGFEARYGDKMSSVLDITYRKPEKFEAKANASMLGGGAYEGWGNKQFSAMASARYKTTRYLLGSLDTKAEYNPRFFDYQTYLNWRPSSKWSFDLLGNISDNTYRFEPEDRKTKFGTMEAAKSFKVYFDGQEKDFFRTYYLASTVTRHFNPETYVALQYAQFLTKEQETYDIQGEYWLNEATTQEQLGVGTYMEHARNFLQAEVQTLGLRFRTRVDGHTLQSGFNVQRQKIVENAVEWEMRDSMGYSLPSDPQQLMLIYSMKSKQQLTTKRLEAFLQDTWRFKTRFGLFNISYGVRAAHWDWNDECIVSPRLSVGLLPNNDKITLRFATGLYYQAPFYKELKDTTLIDGQATTILNKKIKSQRSVHFVLGGDYTFRMFNRPFKFTAEAYYKALSNLIPYTVDNVRVAYLGQNASKGYATGLDLKLFGEFVPGTDSWVTLSLMKTEEKYNGVWLPRPTDQRYNLSLYFTDYFPGSERWRLTLKAAMADGLPFGPSHAKRELYKFRAPAYKRVDMGLSYCLFNNEHKYLRYEPMRWARSAWFGIDFFNLLDINNVNSYYWITDISNTQYAVPNYLTGRQISFRLMLDI